MIDIGEYVDRAGRVHQIYVVGKTVVDEDLELSTRCVTRVDTEKNALRHAARLYHAVTRH